MGLHEKNWLGPTPCVNNVVLALHCNAVCRHTPKNATNRCLQPVGIAVIAPYTLGEVRKTRRFRFRTQPPPIACNNTGL